MQVIAIALVIAIGIAVFAGLGGMRHFREQSQRESFSALKFHDLRVTLADGDYARSGELKRAVAGSGVVATAAEERLLVQTQIDAEPTGHDAITPGLIIGVPVGSPREVDRLRAIRGANLGPADARESVAVIDRSYAKFYGLPDSGTLKLAGGVDLRYVGQGQSPQYFLITSENGFGGESTLGVLYMPLAAAQAYARRPGAVNELVLRLPPGADQLAARSRLESAIAEELPGATVTAGSEEPSSMIAFRDAKNDQRMLSFFGLLVLLGAAIATFNLVSRTVEAERREIGVGMALGVRAGLLGLRPALLGVEIALIGSAFGIAFSYLIAQGFASVMKDFLPLPVYADPFTFAVFVRGAAVGVALPVLATLWPVWRGVRVQPVEAIRVTARSANSGAVRSAARVRLPGGVVAQMPWRNALRTPRRTMLAVVGLAAVLGAMIALLGMMDSFSRTVEVSRAETVGHAPGRVDVYFKGFLRERGAAVRAVGATPGARAVAPRLDLGTELAGAPGTEPIAAVLSIPGSAAAVWSPALERGRPPRMAHEIAIAPRAAEDLGVGLGGSVTARIAGGSGGFAFERVRLRVTGITRDPFRGLAYAATPLADVTGYAGQANVASVMPEPGVSTGTLQRRLVANPAVALTRPVTAGTDALRGVIDQFSAIIEIAALAVLLLAVLMAFNLAGISIDERRREYATMFAFGLPVRRGLALAAIENMVVGLLGTLLGIVLGLLTLGWIVESLVGETWPEIGIVKSVSHSTLGIALLVGVLAVSLTPFLMSRRLTRMDIPSTLRVVE
jgi:putative ABC transport system permease protein